MTEALLIAPVEDAYEAAPDSEPRRREAPARSRRGSAAGTLQPHEVRAELAGGGRQTSADDELIGPYEEGFAAFASGTARQ